MRRKTLSTVRHTCEDLHFRCHSPRVSSRFQSRVSSSVAVLSVSFEEYKNIHSWSCEQTSSSQENRETVLYTIFLILSKHFPYAHKRKQKRELKQRRRRRQRPRLKIIIDLKQKQSLCTRVIIVFVQFFAVIRKKSNLERPNSRFCGEREHTTVNFFILLAGSLERRCYQFTNELKKSRLYF